MIVTTNLSHGITGRSITGFFLFFILLFASIPILYAQQNQPVPAFWSHRFSMVKDVPYGKDEQQRLDLFMQGSWVGEPSYFKPAPTKRPTLLYMHGGGWVGGDKESRIGLLIHYLERGWNVVNIEYRKGNNTAPQAVEDVLAAVKWVAENGEKFNIDTENLVLSGESAGGHLCLIAGLMNSVPGSHPAYVGDKVTIRAIINWFGVSDIARADEFLKGTKWNYVEDWVGDKNKIEEVSKKYSPLYYITPKAPPILSIHGTKDGVVPFTQSQLLHEALEKAGTKNQLLSLRDGKHMGFTEEQFQLIDRTIFAFLEEVMD